MYSRPSGHARVTRTQIQSTEHHSPPRRPGSLSFPPPFPPLPGKPLSRLLIPGVDFRLYLEMAPCSRHSFVLGLFCLAWFELELFTGDFIMLWQTPALLPDSAPGLFLWLLS